MEIVISKVDTGDWWLFMEYKQEFMGTSLEYIVTNIQPPVASIGC